MRVEEINKKSWTNPQGKLVDFIDAKMDGATYAIWNNWQALKVGDEVTGVVKDKGAGRTPGFTIKTINGAAVGFEGGGGGFKKSEPKNESFAASYAKDIAVACIQQGILKESKEIDATIGHYFDLFLGKLATKT